MFDYQPQVIFTRHQLPKPDLITGSNKPWGILFLQRRRRQTQVQGLGEYC